MRKVIIAIIAVLAALRTFTASRMYATAVEPDERCKGWASMS